MKTEDLVNYKRYMVIGNTSNEEKYAYKIKDILLRKGCDVICVEKDSSCNTEVDVIVLCINPLVGLQKLMEYKGVVKGVIIQPGAESDDIRAYLSQKKQQYVEGCILKAIRESKGE